MNLNKIRNTLSNIKSVVDTAITSSGDIGAFDVSKVPGNDLFPGDVQVYGFVIATKAPGVKPIDLLNLCYQIDVYESILSPVIFGDAVIRDSENALLDMLKNECYIELKFATPGREQINYIFQVLTKSDVKPFSNLQGQTYKIEFCSLGYEANLKGMVNPIIYENLTYDKIVEQIVKNRFNSNGLAVCDEAVAHFTPGGVGAKTSFTNKYPFQAIDYCRQAAYSSKYPYSPWLFFENQYGYNFTTLSALIERAKKGINENKVFVFERFNKDDYANVRFNNIMAYNIVADSDIQWLVEHGGLNGAMIIENLNTGNIHELTLSDAGVDQAKMFTSMQDNPGSFTTPTQANIFAKIDINTPASKQFRVMRGEDWYLRSWAIKQLAAKAQVASLLQHVTQVHVYGHSDITVGDGITCWFRYLGHSAEQSTTKVHAGPVTGNYLVSKVRHRIYINDRPGYSQSLELLNTAWNTDLDKV